DDVRGLREAVLDVLNAAGAHDLRAVLRRRTPKHGLVHPVRFANELRTHPERLEHLDGAARDAVGLAELERTVATLDEPGANPGKGRQLCREHRSRGTAADDQHVDRVGKPRRAVVYARAIGLNLPVARLVAVQVELHGASSRSISLATYGPLGPRKALIRLSSAARPSRKSAPTGALPS